MNQIILVMNSKQKGRGAEDLRVTNIEAGTASRVLRTVPTIPRRYPRSSAE